MFFEMLLVGIDSEWSDRILKPKYRFENFSSVEFSLRLKRFSKKFGPWAVKWMSQKIFDL